MVIRNLLGKVRKLGLTGLTGILAFGLGNKASAQEFALQNSNIVQFGARNYSSKWSYGPIVNSSGFYVQFGRGLTDSITAFAEGFVENPVINEGFHLYGYPDNAVDISPNHYIGGMGIGARSKFFKSDDNAWSVCGELKLSRLP